MMEIPVHIPALDIATAKPSGDVVAIIPARGGSKGIPRKNLALLGNKPLLAYSIETALAARRIDRVIVSTEDEEIAETARRWGAEVPFLRPREIAGDKAQIHSAVHHVLNGLAERGEAVRAYVELYPTHPFRCHSTVDFLVDLGLRHWVSVKTVRRILMSPGEAAVIDDRGRLQPIGLVDASGQTVTTMYRPYGMLTLRILTPTVPNMSHYVHVITNPIELIDIDTPPDLEMAQRIIDAGLYDFNA